MEKKQTSFTLQNCIPSFTHSNPTSPTFLGSQTICKLPGYHSPCFILAYTCVSRQNHQQHLPLRIALLLTSPFKCVQSGDRHPSPLIHGCGWDPLGTQSHPVQMVCSSLLLLEYILCRGTKCQFSGENLLCRELAVSVMSTPLWSPFSWSYRVSHGSEAEKEDGEGRKRWGLHKREGLWKWKVVTLVNFGELFQLSGFSSLRWRYWVGWYAAVLHL